jgi:hypothetical protein
MVLIEEKPKKEMDTTKLRWPQYAYYAVIHVEK